MQKSSTWMDGWIHKLTILVITAPSDRERPRRTRHLLLPQSTEEPRPHLDDNCVHIAAEEGSGPQMEPLEPKSKAPRDPETAGSPCHQRQKQGLRCLRTAQLSAEPPTALKRPPWTTTSKGVGQQVRQNIKPCTLEPKVLTSRGRGKATLLNHVPQVPRVTQAEPYINTPTHIQTHTDHSHTHTRTHNHHYQPPCEQM